MLTATKARTSAIRRGSAACGATGAITSTIRRGSAVFGVEVGETNEVVFDQNVLPRGVTSKNSECS